MTVMRLQPWLTGPAKGGGNGPLVVDAERRHYVCSNPQWPLNRDECKTFQMPGRAAWLERCQISRAPIGADLQAAWGFSAKPASVWTFPLTITGVFRAEYEQAGISNWYGHLETAPLILLDPR